VASVRYALVLLLLAALLAAGALIGLLNGHGSLREADLRAIFLELRACRAGAAALAGAALAVGGVLMQGLFRNPLASPDVLGCSAGAHVGGQLVLLAVAGLSAPAASWMAQELALPAGCLLGAAAALAVLMLVVGRDAGLATLLLAGVILTSLYGALSAFLTSLGQDSWQLGRSMVAFSLGGVDGTGPRQLLLAAPLLAAGLAAAWGWGRALDLMLAGEEEAASLGVDVAAVRRWTLVWTAVLTAVAVILGGGVAFVGVVVPHLCRPLVGVGHRRLIPAAALGGAAYLVWCDDLARSLPATGEIPLGVVTGILGAPLFLAVLLRSRREGLA
jgi:iron complex transport system permease protein